MIGAVAILVRCAGAVNQPNVSGIAHKRRRSRAKKPADDGLLASRRRWHGNPSVLIMKYLCAALAAGERR
jgi:hypothetical protein